MADLADRAQIRVDAEHTKVLVRQPDTDAAELPFTQQRIERRHAGSLGQPVTLMDLQSRDAFKLVGYLPRQDRRAAHHMPQRR